MNVSPAGDPEAFRKTVAGPAAQAWGPPVDEAFDQALVEANAETNANMRPGAPVLAARQWVGALFGGDFQLAWDGLDPKLRGPLQEAAAICVRRSASRPSEPQVLSATVDPRLAEALMLGGDLRDLAELLNRPAWQARAACRGLGVELFMTGRGELLDAPMRVCRRCPVSGECLDYALAHTGLVGIWGGTSARQRQRLRQAEPPGARRVTCPMRVMRSPS